MRYRRATVRRRPRLRTTVSRHARSDPPTCARRCDDLHDRQGAGTRPKWLTVGESGVEWGAVEERSQGGGAVFFGTHTPRSTTRAGSSCRRSSATQLAEGLVVTKGRSAACSSSRAAIRADARRGCSQAAADERDDRELRAAALLRRLRRAPRQAGPGHHPADAARVRRAGADCVVIGAMDQTRDLGRAGWDAVHRPSTRTPSPTWTRRWPRGPMTADASATAGPPTRPGRAPRSSPAPRCQLAHLPRCQVTTSPGWRAEDLGARTLAHGGGWSGPRPDQRLSSTDRQQRAVDRHRATEQAAQDSRVRGRDGGP